jgi:uncharacterized membrane protein YdjX (TVP38/TMEM64 family)
MPSTTRDDARARARLAIAVAVLAAQALIALSPAFDLGTTVEVLRNEHAGLRRELDRAPLAATVQFFALYVAASTLLLPGAALLSLTAGAVFGLTAGVLIASTASTLGAWIAFMVTRGLLSEWFERVAPAALQRPIVAIERLPTRWLVAARLIPLVPFAAINVVFGLTRMSSLRFAAASFASMLPGTIAYVALGTELSEFDTDGRLMSPVQGLAAPMFWALTIAGLAVAVAAWRGRAAVDGRVKGAGGADPPG